MNEFGLSFHHLGLAVQTPESAFLYLKALGYREGAAVYDPLQRVNLAMRHHETMPDVEVIWPGAGPSPIDSVLKRGSMVYHLCYVSADAAGSVAAIEAAGLRIMPVLAPTAAALFGGREVSFYTVVNFGLIEIIHGAPASA